MADEQMADESGWRAADHNARIVADQRDQIVKLGAEIERLRAAMCPVCAHRRGECPPGRCDRCDDLRDAADEIERLRAALREIRALHEPEWASEEAKAAGKEPLVCALCGTADGLWPCSTVATIREVLGDE